MTAIHHPAQRVDTSAAEQPTTTAYRVLAVLRIGFGLTFLWAFLDKTFALGYHTGYDQAGNLDRFGDAAWINGGSPTEGFLAFEAPTARSRTSTTASLAPPGRTGCSCSACSASGSRSSPVSFRRSGRFGWIR